MRRGGFFDLSVGTVEHGFPEGNAWPWIHWIRREWNGLTISFTPWRNIGDYLITYFQEGLFDEQPKRAREQCISLLTTQPHFGGVRYWFECPVCEAQVRTLHLPKGPLNSYLCRQCNHLTYGSSQRSHTENAKWSTQRCQQPKS